MDDNYWKNSKLIQATQEEKEEILGYEIGMFRETCRQLNFYSRTLFERNLLLESLPVHSRALIDFFYNDKNEKYPNDLVAQDFLPDTTNWKTERPPITKLLEDAKNKADKQVAHMGLWRIKIEQDDKKGWDWNSIWSDVEKVIEKFESLR